MRFLNDSNSSSIISFAFACASAFPRSSTGVTRPLSLSLWILNNKTQHWHVSLRPRSSTGVTRPLSLSLWILNNKTQHWHVSLRPRSSTGVTRPLSLSLWILNNKTQHWHVSLRPDTSNTVVLVSVYKTKPTLQNAANPSSYKAKKLNLWNLWTDLWSRIKPSSQCNAISNCQNNDTIYSVLVQRKCGWNN